MSVVDEIKERVDIVEVIRSYVPLKKAGRSYKGLCPFHSEKTPSFVVFPHTGTWHCFGACGTGGDIFTFIMKRENLDFGEALRLLAQRAGVELEGRSTEAAETEKRLDLLREINQTTALYFHDLLLNSAEAAQARAYLDQRGLNRETIDRFQIGYALNRWDGLLRYLTDKGYAVALVHQAGLIVEREDHSGYYDRFRGRIIFPIRDDRGRTIGFGGRVLDDTLPKYLNSPQTPLFDKGSVLFGLDQAKAGIRTTGEAVLVEGYMDVLMAHQHGLNNVVAQMGTALTEAQLRLLKRHTRRFILALDADVAGDQATLRGLDVARQVIDREVVPVPTPRGLIRFEERLAADIRIVSLPPGRDPDEVIRADPAHWAQLIAQARPVMDFYFQALTADLDLATAHGKAETVRRLGPLIVVLGDRVQQAHYLQQLARMVQVDERSLWQQIRQEAPPGQPRRPAQEPAKASLGLDGHCVSLLLRYGGLLAQANAELRSAGEEEIGAEDLLRPEDRAILAAWRRWLAGNGSPEAQGEFYDTLDEPLQERVKTLLEAQTGRPPVPYEMAKDDLLDAITRLRLRRLQQQIQELTFLLADDPDSRATCGPMITALATRKARLEKAMNRRSLAGRRQQEDAAVRIPGADD